MITEYGIEAKSNSEIISELGGRFKQYRLFSNLTQKEVARKTQEMKKIRSFITKRPSKCDFELLYIEAYDTFFKQAIACEEMMQECDRKIGRAHV